MAIACLPLAGRYEIVKPLNSGGMGAVYEARDLRLNDSPCAVKQLLHSRGRGEYLNAKFEAEMAVLASLDHPGIPKIRDFFTENSRRYLVMDLIPGPNLYQVLETGGPLEARGLVSEMLQVLDILGYLHGRDLLHRDVKPANLIRDSRSGRLKLVDFGLARSFELGELTQTLVGTSGYAPPEQLAGRAEPASDLYALGATMLHLLTGVSPLFAYPTLDKALDPALLAVLRKAVAMHPRERYPDAATFAAALQSWLNTPQQTANRRNLMAGATASLAAATLLGLALPRPAAPAPVVLGSQPTVAQAPAVAAVAPPAPLSTPTEVALAEPVASTWAIQPVPGAEPVTLPTPAAARAMLATVRRLAQLPSLSYPVAGPRKARPEEEADFQPVLGSESLPAPTAETQLLSSGGPLFLRQHGVRLHIPFGYDAREENGEIVAVPGKTMPALPHREVRARVYQSVDAAVSLVATFKAKVRSTGELVSEEELADGYRVTLNDRGSTVMHRILVRERGKVRYVCETTGRVESQARDLVRQVQPFFASTTLDGKAPLLNAAPVTVYSYNTQSQFQSGSNSGSSAGSTPAATTPVAPPAATTPAGPPSAPTVPLGAAPTTTVGTGAAASVITPAPTTSTSSAPTASAVSPAGSAAPAAVLGGAAGTGGGAAGYVGGFYGQANGPMAPAAPVPAANVLPVQPAAGYGGPPLGGASFRR